MAPKKKLLRSFIPRLVVVFALLILYGCGGGSAGPNPTPTATPAPTMQLVDTQSFQGFRVAIGPTGFSPRATGPGVFIFVAEWTPAPPSGDAYLFAVRGQDQGERDNCIIQQYTCAYILAKDVGTTYPKRVEFRVTTDERIFWWVKVTAGESIAGTVKIYFLPG